MAGGKGVELATAYLTLIPSLKGATRSINDQLSGIDASKSGVTIGKTLSDGLSRGVSADSVEVLERAVTSAEDSVSDALYRSEQATRQVEVAQKRLAEARKKYGDDSSQAAQAELNLMNAQHRSESAGRALEQVQAKLSDAQDELAAATDRAGKEAEQQSSALSKLSSVAKRVGPALESAGESMSAIGDKLMPVTAAIAGSVAAAGAFAVSTASAAETSEMAFTTMLGSAEAARDMLDELASFAAHTPFELSGLTTATQQLLAYGFTAEDIIPMLTAVGDATAALGTGQAGIESVTRALGQMQTRGKVTAEEMLQLTEAGIPAWEYLARAIGTDTAGAMEAVTDGAVSADAAIAALTQGMEQDFGGMMEEQSKTVEGLFSNLSDAIEQPLMALRDTGAYEHFADALSDVVDAAGPFVESLLPHMERGIDVLSGVLDAAAGAMEGFAKMSRGSQEQLLQVVAVAAAAGPALKVLGPAVKAVGAAMKSLEAASMGVVGVLGAVAAAVVAVGIVDFATDLAEAEEHERLLSEATMDLSDIMGEASDQAAQSGAAIGEAMYAAKDAAGDALQSLADLNEDAADTMADFYVQSDMLGTYLDTIEELAGQSGLTATEQEKLAQAVEGYNEITGDSVSVIDAANGKLSTSTEELMENARAWRENAEAQAYQSLATQYLEEQLSAERELAQAREDLAAAQEHFAQLQESGASQLELAAAAEEVGQLEQSVDDLSTAADQAADNYEAFSAEAILATSEMGDAMKDAVTGLPEYMQVAGIDIAESLSAGIESGSVSADDAAWYLSTAVEQQVSRLPASLREEGMAAALGLADAISSGQITAQQAAQILEAAIDGEVSSLPPELQELGAQAAEKLSYSLGDGSELAAAESGDLATAAALAVAGLPEKMGLTGAEASAGFAGGILGGRGATASAAGQVADAASGMDDVGDTWSWGYELGANFASGLAASAGRVASSALSVANEAWAYLHHSTPERGPLADDDRWGGELVENFASGMLDALPALSRAAAGVAQAADPGASARWRAGAPMPVAGSSRGGDSYTIYIDGEALSVDSRIREAFSAFIEAVARRRSMGMAVTA